MVVRHRFVLRTPAPALRLMGALLCAVLSLVAALALTAAPASAEVVHPFVGSFEVASGSFPEAVAVSQSTGDVFVYDAAAGGSIDKFGATGAPEDFSALSGNSIAGVGGGSVGRVELAVSSAGPAAGDVYLANGSDVQVFGASGVKLGELDEAPAAGAPWGEPCGVAVDPAGNVYVGLYPESVDEYSPSGSVVTNGDYKASLLGLNSVCQLAADSAGNVYVDSSPEGPVTKYEASQFAVAPLPAVGTQVDATGSFVAVDPISNDLYVDDEEGVAQYDSAGTLLGRSGESGAGALRLSRGVGVRGGAGGEQLYAVDFAGSGGNYRVNRFGPGVVQVEVVTEAASAVTPVSATLNGSVDPAGVPVTACQFEYGTEEGVFTKTAPCVPPPGAGTSPVAVSAQIVSLTPHSTYYYRLSATGANGTIVGKDQEFTTAGQPLVRGQTAEVNTGTPEGQSSATLRGEIDPGSRETTYHFEYDTRAYEQGEGPHGTSVPVPDETLGAGGEFVAVAPVALNGLTLGTTYYYRLVADNEYGSTDGPGRRFATLGAVAIDSESVSKATAASALLAAQINPLGQASEYRFEYLSEAEYEANLGGGREGFAGAVLLPSPPSPEGQLGSGVGDVGVSAQIEGLVAGTGYRYRVVAHNALGELAGPARAFETQSGEGAGLIDGRGWELVSPPDKHGAALEAITHQGGDIQASADGSRLAYIALAPATGEPAGSTSSEAQELLSTREGGGVWETQSIETPNEAVGRLGAKGQSEYKLLSPDLSAAIVEPEDDTLLSPSASERTPYLREADGEYLPLVTGCPPVTEHCPPDVKEHEDVPPGTKFGPPEPEGRTVPGTGVEFDSATPDVEHAIVNAPQALTQGFDTGGDQALYEWSETPGPGEKQLEPISLVKGGESAAVQGGAVLGDEGVNMRGAISANGDRVFFETAKEHHLFMRDVARHASLQLDKSEPGVAAPPGGAAVYQDANSEGSRVFFADKERLTDDSGAGFDHATGQEDSDLYECEIAEGAGGELECKLSDLTPLSPEGEQAAVQGFVIGASEDGSYVYFVANGILANDGTPVPGAVPGDCQNPLGTIPPGSVSCNLYVWHDGITRLVAVLSGRDFPDWAPERGLTTLTARVSPDGSYLAFMSQRSLTGYDNDDVNEQPTKAEEESGVSPQTRVKHADEEVFLYHAPENLATESGGLICASCDPSGARPDGLLEPSELNPLLVDRASAWEEQWVAASVPGWTDTGNSVALYQSRYLNDEGRLFFDSPADLVPAATNEKEDVYELEPEGVGGCTSSTSSASVSFKPARSYTAQGAGEEEGAKGEEGAGCVGLISAGTSGEESAFLDASESGDDVFFLTAARLSPRDTDEALDVYDAHVCTSGWACPTPTSTLPPACTNPESCRSAPEPQPEVYGPPGTATFSGPGNPPTPAVVKPKTKSFTRAQKLAAALGSCRKKYKKSKKRKSACERQAHKTYAAAKKTSRRGK
jgi:hypothetical protein